MARHQRRRRGDPARAALRGGLPGFLAGAGLGRLDHRGAVVRQPVPVRTGRGEPHRHRVPGDCHGGGRGRLRCRGADPPGVPRRPRGPRRPPGGRAGSAGPSGRGPGTGPGGPRDARHRRPSCVGDRGSGGRRRRAGDLPGRAHRRAAAVDRGDGSAGAGRVAPGAGCTARRQHRSAAQPAARARRDRGRHPRCRRRRSTSSRTGQWSWQARRAGPRSARHTRTRRHVRRCGDCRAGRAGLADRRRSQGAS